MAPEDAVYAMNHYYNEEAPVELPLKNVTMETPCGDYVDVYSQEWKVAAFFIKRGITGGSKEEIDARMAELEQYVVNLPHRDTNSLIGFAFDFASVFSEPLSKAFAIYDMLSNINYSDASRAISKAVEKGNGIVVTHQVSWESDVFGATYHPKYWPASIIREWDCSNGYYMNNDDIYYRQGYTWYHYDGDVGDNGWVEYDGDTSDFEKVDRSDIDADYEYFENTDTYESYHEDRSDSDSDWDSWDSSDTDWDSDW